MKKLVFLALCLVSSFVGVAQVSNLPASMGRIDMFSPDTAYFTIIFPSGYTFESPKVELWNNGLKLSDSTDVVISGDTLKFEITPTQMVPLKKTPYLFISNGPTYILGSPVYPSVSVAIPTFVTKTINISGIGFVRVLMEGDAGDAIAAANAAQSAADQAIEARDSTNTLLYGTGSLINSKLPQGTMDDLRSFTPATYGFNVFDGLRSGLFIYDPSDVTSADDSATVIRQGTKRFKRFTNVYTPQMFGVIPNDGLDDKAGFQKMFNFASARAQISGAGTDIYIPDGRYLLSGAVDLKPNSSGLYKITVKGAGKSLTIIQGMGVATGEPLFRMNLAAGLNYVDSYAYFETFTMLANGASQCFYANKLWGAKFIDMMFHGGEENCLAIGTYGAAEGYSNYITRCYFNGITLSGGSNYSLIKLHQTRFTVIRDIETDGGRYGIDIYGSDKTDISGGKIEGSAQAAIYQHGGYGGETRISDVYINPYFPDRNAQYAGESVGILVNGGGTNGQFLGNRIYMNGSADTTGRSVWTYTSTTWIRNLTNQNYIWTGGTSGATAIIFGLNTTDKRIIFTSVTGTFVAGETLTQATTGYVMVLDSRVQIKPNVGIKVSNSDYNLIANNQIHNTNSGIEPYTFRIQIVGNTISASQLGIRGSGEMVMVGNRVESAGKAVERGSAAIQGAGNYFSGDVSSLLNSSFDASSGNTTFKGRVDVFGGSGVSTFGSDGSNGNTRTDATSKSGRIGVPHYTNAEEPMALVMGTAGSSTNVLTVGGGSSLANAATEVNLNTAANNTTVTGTTRARLFSSGNMMVQPAGGTFTDIPTAALSANSTTQGFLPPRMTTTQRDAISSPATGLMIINTTTNKINFYNGTAWEAVTSAP